MTQSPRTQGLLDAVALAGVLIFVPGLVALYPALMAICVLPGWDTFLLTWAMGFVFCVGILALVVWGPSS